MANTATFETFQSDFKDYVRHCILELAFNDSLSYADSGSDEDNEKKLYNYIKECNSFEKGINTFVRKTIISRKFRNHIDKIRIFDKDKEENYDFITDLLFSISGVFGNLHDDDRDNFYDKLRRVIAKYQVSIGLMDASSIPAEGARRDESDNEEDDEEDEEDDEEE